jgi:hypothetical protein
MPCSPRKTHRHFIVDIRLLRLFAPEPRDGVDRRSADHWVLQQEQPSSSKAPATLSAGVSHWDSDPLFVALAAAMERKKMQLNAPSDRPNNFGTES